MPSAAETREICHELGIDWEPGMGATSIGGLVTRELGRVPVPGDTVQWQGLRLEVLSANPRRAEEVRIIPPSSSEEEGRAP